MGMTLDEAIEQLVNLGEKDPLKAAQALIKRNDQDWLVGELAALAEEVIADRIRRRLGAMRRSTELALRPGQIVPQHEMRLRVFPVPHENGYWEYKPFGQVTVDDLERRARYYDGGAIAFLKRAKWCRDVADMIRGEDVETAGKLTAELPPLPDDADIELPVLNAVAA